MSRAIKSQNSIKLPEPIFEEISTKVIYVQSDGASSYDEVVEANLTDSSLQKLSKSWFQDKPIYLLKETFQSNLQRLSQELELDYPANELTLLAALSHRVEVIDLSAHLTDDCFLSLPNPSD
jgi:hypothetical protein